MGNKQTVFTPEQLDAYQDATFFTRKEILRLFDKYRDLAPQLVPQDYTSKPNVKLPYELIASMPELKDNPFRQRIAEVFSEDGEGNMTLDDFLDMFSVMSEMAPRDLKAYYAFRIYGGGSIFQNKERGPPPPPPPPSLWPGRGGHQEPPPPPVVSLAAGPSPADFNEDSYICKSDLEKTVNKLTRQELTPEEVSLVCQKVMDEADLDNDGKLSLEDFQHMIVRAPDFLRRILHFPSLESLEKKKKSQGRAAKTIQGLQAKASEERLRDSALEKVPNREDSQGLLVEQVNHHEWRPLHRCRFLRRD